MWFSHAFSQCNVRTSTVLLVLSGVSHSPLCFTLELAPHGSLWDVLQSILKKRKRKKKKEKGTVEVEEEEGIMKEEEEEEQMEVGGGSPAGTPTPGSPSSTPPPLCLRELPSSTTTLPSPLDHRDLSTSRPLDHRDLSSSRPLDHRDCRDGSAPRIAPSSLLPSALYKPSVSPLNFPHQFELTAFSMYCHC